MKPETAAVPAINSQTTDSMNVPSSDETATEKSLVRQKDICETSSTNGCIELASVTETTEEWIEGSKLVMVVVSLILGTFLMLLDTSIIATVGQFGICLLLTVSFANEYFSLRTGYSAYHRSVPCFG